jgi:serine/threonine-protein kinase RsbW
MRDEALFGVCPDGEFFGRGREIDYICRRAADPRRITPGIFLAGRRWAGKTEVLRRVHRSLFLNQADVTPVYYQFKGYGGVDVFAEDFLKEVIKQRMAFVRRDPRMLKSEASLDRLERLLLEDDSYDMVDIIVRHREARKSGDLTAALRNAIKAPYLITLHSEIPVYLILDDFHLVPGGATPGANGSGVMKEVGDVLNLGSCPFLVSSPTRRILEGGDLNGSIEAMELTGLDTDGAVSMMAELCRLHNVGFDSEILTIAAKKLEGTPLYMKNIVWSAGRYGRNITALRDFSDLYAGELAEGNTGFVLRSSLRLSGIKELRVLNECVRTGLATSEEELSEKLGYGVEDLKGAITGLSAAGLVDSNLGYIKWSGDGVLRDFIRFTYETRVRGRSVDEVKTSIIRGSLKEGYELKGARVRSRIKEEALKALKSFNGQKVPKAFLRNQAFLERSKDGVFTPEGKEEDVELPQIVGSFDTSRWEKGETGMTVVAANGFQNSRYGDSDEVVWITGIKEAQTQVNLGDVENFIRRSLILRENFKTPRIVRWIASQAGFTEEARKRADGDGIFTSDMAQLRAIRDSMEKASGESKGAGAVFPTKEFEVTLPSAIKAELVAARAVEEIGAGMGFDENSIGQIKAALIEACINAFEHSRVKDSKVFLRFVAGGDRLTIHVENPGADFEASDVERPSRDGGKLPRKRGWGIELMKGFMDEVRFEKLMGGVKIVLVKYLTKRGENRDDQKT